MIKRNAMIRLVVLGALVSTVAWLWLEQREPAVPEIVEKPSPTPRPSASARLTREEAYQRDLQALQKLAESENEAAAMQAAQQMETMIQMHQSELAIEEALKNAGFGEDVLVVAQGSAVTVMVPQHQWTEENSARILALCVTYADVRAENIRIMDY